MDLLALMVPLREWSWGAWGGLCAHSIRPPRLGGHGGQGGRSDLTEARWPLILDFTFPAAPLGALSALMLFFQMGSPMEIFSLSQIHMHQLGPYRAQAS